LKRLEGIGELSCCRICPTAGLFNTTSKALVHKNITNNLYEITKAGDSAFVDIKCNFVLVNQLSEYDSFIREKGYDGRKIQILTAIIWLNMAPLYDGKLRQFLFYFGKLNLHLAI
jgi:hypothetical protein